MKYEDPYIEICKFDTEDIATSSSVADTDYDNAIERATSLNAPQGASKAVFKITF